MLNFRQSHMIAKMETPQPSSIRKPFDIGQSHIISKIETPQPSSIRKQLDVSQRQIISKMETLQPSSVRKQSGKADLLPSPSTTTRPSIFESQQFSMGGRQVSQAMVQPSIPAHLGPYSSVFSNQQSLEVVISPKNYQLPVPLRFDSQQFEQASKFQSGVKQSPRNHNQTYVNVGTPFTLTSSKHQARQFVGSHQFPSTNVCPPAELPVKFNAEIESVRSKLRESLTSALATVSNEPCNSKSVDVSYTDEEKSKLSQAEASSIQNEIHPSVKDGSLYENTCDYLNSNNQVKNFGGDKELHDEVILSGSIGDQKEVDVVCDVQEGQHQNVVLDAVPLSHSIIEDELLRDHGLCWVSDLTSPSVDSELHSLSKRPKLAHTEGSRDMIDTGLQTSEKLAAQIEAELFKLFGGVNKKYKEKGRSLLFNLKDHSNPELRERVLSGDVPPERLCSMSAEELASKELSQWRQAKAEEFAQMVMLPDMNVDIRRLVRKTHKGEFQVEVEQDDGVQPEVGLVSDVLSKMLTKTNEVDHARSISSEMGLTSSSSHDSEKSTELAEGGKFGLNEGKDSRFLENVDCTQEYTIEEMKETKLPPVVSLDEFMQDLDSEPPFQNLEGNNLQENTSAVDRTLDRLGSESVHVSDNQEHKLDFTPDTDISASKLDLVNVSDSQLHTGHIHAKHTKEISVSTDQIDYKYQATDDKMKAESEYEKQVKIADSAKNCSNIWEGFLQLNVSALSNVTSSFLSGEKTSMQGWPDFLEVKGRVRLDAFEKFLQELPLSRSRAIMIVEFRWKEDSMESGRLHLSEAIHSYIADDRVGFAEPAPGVELYLCPPHPKITNMLANHLSKDLLETVCSVVNALLGIVVWRRPHGIISPRLPSHHKHGSGGSKKHSTSKKHQESRPNSNPVHAPVSKPAPPPDEDIDDVPPGFGPPVARDADDLPEFDFSRGNRFVGSVTSAPSAPSAHVRELIQKYGHGGNAVPELGIPVQPWNEEDDIPEWYPNQSMKHAYQTAQSLPLPPLQAPPMLPPQGFLQPPPFMMNPPHLQPVFHPPSAVWWPAAVQAMPDGGGPMRPCHFGGQPGGPRMPGPRMAQGFGFNFWRPDNSGL